MSEKRLDARNRWRKCCCSISYVTRGGTGIECKGSQAENDEKLFDQYVLGGVDILYEKLIESATSTEDYLKNLYDFMEDMDDRYNQTIDSDQISSLCRLAKK